MKTFLTSVCAIGLLAGTTMLTACDNDYDSDYDYAHKTALVTVRPTSEGAFTMSLDDTTKLYPVNMKQSPFGNKEVRALVDYRIAAGTQAEKNQVLVLQIDSIRTKATSPTMGSDEANTQRYGNDPIEIVKDWVTVAEDGYLTLRIRTRWGYNHTAHYVYLVTGTNKDNAYELELRHNACGDTKGHLGDALIAFNLQDLPRTESGDVKIKLTWTSFEGKKSADFTLRIPEASLTLGSENIAMNRRVK